MFKTLQKDARILYDWIIGKLGKEPDSSWVLITYLLAECGEVADKARALEGNRINSKNISKDDLAKEIVDAVYNLMLIANFYSINLDKYWDKRLSGIKGKFK